MGVGRGLASRRGGDNSAGESVRSSTRGLLALLLTALLAGSLLTLSPTAARASGACTDVQFIGVRGSGENPPDPSEHGMGALVGPMADKAAALATDGATVSFYGLPYTAASADTGVFNGNYYRSEAQGESMLKSYLDSTVAACPDMKLVVMGYSQGAQVAGNVVAAESASVWTRIAALVMFGDPHFNPQAAYDQGTYDPRDRGLAGARSLSDFSGRYDKVGSWCNQNDLICQGAGWGHSTGSHHASVYINNYATVVASFIRKRVGWSWTKPNLPIDLAFAIDSTGSMSSSISGAEDAASHMASELSAQHVDARVALVDYKDTDQGDPYAAQVDQGFTGDVSSFQDALGGLVASGGGDGPEAVYSGLMTAINDLSWRNGARKAIVVMGDAPGKDPEPVTGYTRSQVLAAAYALDPAVLYPIAIGSYPADFMQPLADGSDGELFQADDPSSVTDTVLAVVQKASTPIYAGLTVGVGHVGTPSLFSAASSWYDAGDIVQYDWDFDGDGVTDATTTTPTTNHTYDSPFGGTASVTVTTSDDNTATASAPVTVTEAPAEPLGAPSDLTASPGSDDRSANVAWSPPAGSDPADLAGYVVEIDDSDGQPAALTTTDGDVTEAEIPDLDPDHYAVSVYAVDHDGPGPVANTHFALSPPPPPAAPAPPAPTLAARSSANPSTEGSAVTFTATMTPVPSCGSVSWLIDGTPPSSAVATGGSSGTITLGPISDLPVGTHPVTAAYSGCASAGATTATISQEVTPAPSAEPTSTAGVPTLLGPPTIIGTVKVGNRVRCTASYDNATWQGTAWLLDGERIPGKVSAPLRLTAADFGHKLSCQAAAYNANGWSSESVTPTASVSRGRALRHLGRVSIAGTVTVGHVLTASAGRWSPSPTRVAYHWLRNGAPIRGASGRHYRLRARDAGARISVVITAIRHGYRHGRLVRTVHVR